MNRNALHQSSPLQPVMAVEGPNWWAINKMRPQNPSPPPPQHSSFLAHPNLIPQYPLSTWIDNQELPADQSWSQLLMGGTTSEEDKSVLRQMQQGAKKLDIWEEQLLEQEASNGCNFTDHLKQENNYHGNITNISKPSSSWSMQPVSSPTSCITSSLTTTNMLDFSNIKAQGRHLPPDRSSECNSTGNGGVAKKARLQPSSSTQSSTFKVRKEKLGDRITALHQLVSPFGKTDTASVLLEALGYIRFLQSQIEALSLPYLGSGSGNNSRQQQSESIEEVKKDLSSKGLCLVPISCTVQVGSDNGADYWAAAASGGGF